MSKMGVRIKQRRKELGMTADDLADKLGISRSTVFRYENGDIEKVPADLVDNIAKVLITTPAYIMGWDGEPVTIAAHLDTSDLTQAELEDVASYIEFIKNKRKK